MDDHIAVEDRSDVVGWVVMVEMFVVVVVVVDNYWNYSSDY